MTRVPTLTPLRGLPQEMTGVANIGEMDVRKRVNPGMSVREAKVYGDKAAVAQHKVLGGSVSRWDRTPRLLETTHAEFQIMRW